MKKSDLQCEKFLRQMEAFRLWEENVKLMAEKEVLQNDLVELKLRIADMQSTGRDLMQACFAGTEQVKRLKEELKAVKKASAAATRAQRMKYADAVKAERHRCRDLVAKGKAPRIRQRKSATSLEGNLFMGMTF